MKKENVYAARIEEIAAMSLEELSAIRRDITKKAAEYYNKPDRKANDGYYADIGDGLTYFVDTKLEIYLTGKKKGYQPMKYVVCIADVVGHLEGRVAKKIRFPFCKWVNPAALTRLSYMVESITMDICPYIGQEAFALAQIREIHAPKAKIIEQDAFQSCGYLSKVDLPSCVVVCTFAFRNCDLLPEIDLPEVKIIRKWAFNDCVRLTCANLPNCSLVEYEAFSRCYRLEKAGIHVSDDCVWMPF